MLTDRNNKPLLYLAYFIITIPLFIAITYALGASTDNMSSLLIAKDIAHGNLRLNDWYLSTQPYVFSDTIWAALLIKIFGYSPVYAHIVGTTFFSLSLLMCILSSKKNGKLKASALIFVPVFFIPTQFTGVVTLGLCIHGGIYLLTSISLYFLSQSSLQNPAPKLLVIAALSIAVAFSDKLLIIIFTVPLFLAGVTWFIKTKENNYLFIALSSALSIFLTYIFIKNRFFFFQYEIPGEMSPTIAGIPEILHNAALFIEGLQYFFAALIFNGDRLFILSLMGLAGGVIFVSCSLYAFFRYLLTDFYNTLLCFCIATPVGAFLLTTAASDFTSSRYFLFSLVCCAILIARNIDINRRFRWVFVIFCFAWSASNIPDLLARDNSYEVDSEGLTSFLEGHDLHHGYSEFWLSAVTASASRQDIVVAPASFDSMIRPMRFLSKESWYKYKGKIFVIVTDDKQREAVLRSFGRVSDELKYKRYTILVFNSASFYKDSYAVYGKELATLPLINGSYNNGAIDNHGKSGVMTFGPYIDICGGDYLLKVDFKGAGTVHASVGANGEAALLSKEIKSGMMEIFHVNGCMRGLEVTLSADGEVLLTGYSFTKQ